MIQESFDVRGKVVNVAIDEVSKSSATFSFVENGVTNEYGIKFIGIDKKAKSLMIGFYHHLKDNVGNILSSRSDKYQGSDQGEYDIFYDKDTVGISFGVDVDKAALNGLMQDILEGAFCFNPLNDYNFFQPLTFDLIGTSPTDPDTDDGEINVSMVDGAAGKTLTYNIDDGAFSADSSFDSLSAGTYKIGVITAEDGIPFYKSVTI